MGQGTRAALFQSVMLKPPSVRYAYPLTLERDAVALPSFFEDKKIIVVFNIEAGRADDLTYDSKCQNKLFVIIQDIL